MSDTLTVGLAQIRPEWLDRDRTISAVIDWIGRAARDRYRLIVFGELFVP